MVGKNLRAVPFAAPDIGEEEIEAVAHALRSGWLTTGPNTEQFEQAFGEYLGGETTALAVNSATAGLHLALEAIGVGPGDQVIVPTWTFTATAEVVRYLGAEPVIVDVESETLNIKLDAVQSTLNSNTRAVIPVHFAGLPVDTAALRELVEPMGVAVVEDAAHALPAYSRGTPVGRAGTTATVFSFYATKTMTTGEGGMVVSSDKELLTRMRTMRLHGIDRDVFRRYSSKSPSWQYQVIAPGYKYNLTDLASALGIVQLRRLEAMHSRRRQIAEFYDSELASLPVQLPARPDSSSDSHAWHLYVLRLRPEAPLSRDAFIVAMAEQSVACSVHFIPLHRHPYWRNYGNLSDDQFPVASREFPRVVSLPIFSAMSDDQIISVAEAARSVLGGR